jgi:long-chain acyl-CoA synthetase
MTIRGLLERSVERVPGSEALKWCENKEWKTKTWFAFLRGIREVAEGYGRRFGLTAQVDNAAIILPNHPVWMESYLAQSGTGVSVIPIDPKLHNDEVAYILNDAEVQVVTTDAAHLKMMIEIGPQLPRLRAIVITDGVIFDNQKIDNRIEVIGYEKLRIKGGGEWYDNHIAKPDDVASIIYTSGTTGKPKGAMLTHRNFVSDIEGAFVTFKASITSKDSFLIVLPLFHAFSFAANFVLPLMLSCEMLFIESLRTVGHDIQELKPSVLMAVPLLAEKLYDKIQEGIQKSKVAQILLKLGIRGPVMHMILQKLGGRLRYMITGGAPCPKHVLEGFRKMHVNFLEGYGLTECAPVVSVTSSDCKKVGTIGFPIDCCEVRLADMNQSGVGELQVKGPNVMKGYYHNEAATAEAFDGEWLRTGDLASMDDEGLITIRGRKKALIVNREGKNIYPEEVENVISKAPEVQDIIVVGYTQGGVPGERVGAIAYPNVDWFTQENGGKELEWGVMERRTQRAVQNRAAELADYKRVRKVVVSKEPLVRTSVGKVKRVTYKGTLDE